MPISLAFQPARLQPCAHDTIQALLNPKPTCVRRSPAEGAYSEGFVASKFTQDFCIECPATASLFSLKTGEIVSWYPNNPVLRMLTPQDTCRKLQIYPVKLTQVRAADTSSRPFLTCP